MSERLLSRKEIGEKLSTSPGVAAEILAQNGVQPIDLGRGRHRGYRWSASAVDGVILAMHAKAQTIPLTTRRGTSSIPKPHRSKSLALADMTYADIFALTQAQNVQ